MLHRLPEDGNSETTSQALSIIGLAGDEWDIEPCDPGCSLQAALLTPISNDSASYALPRPKTIRIAINITLYIASEGISNWSQKINQRFLVGIYCCLLSCSLGSEKQ